MRVALLSRNARPGDAIGQQVSAKLSYFQQLGAEVRVYLSEATSVSDAQTFVGTSKKIWQDDSQREYLISSDLVIAEFGAAYDLMYLLPALQGLGPRIIIEYHGLTPSELADSGLQHELQLAQRQRLLHWAGDIILVHSQFSRQELIDATGIPEQRIHLIPCWVAPVRADEIDSGTILRQRHGLSQTQILLFVGRFARNKQPQLLIEALHQLRIQEQQLHLVFVGPQDDVYHEHLAESQRLIQQLGLQERVHFLGRVPDHELAAWYQAADVLALPSLHECFGMPAVEAMQRGKPVLISPDGALPEVVQHGGIQCDATDSQAWADSISRMITKPKSKATNKIAIVTHRFGSHFAGGAEKSLRIMAHSLQALGFEVEIFTTCNTHESQWSNTLPIGTIQEDGFTVHRFSIDTFDANQLGQAYQAIRELAGNVTAEVEATYLQNSLGSQTLLAALEERRDEWQAIITGPYLFKLIFEVAQQFADRVLLAPCFHDEPLAKLRCFQQVYRQVAGLLFHTEAEAGFTARNLGISHPRHVVVGTVLSDVLLQRSEHPVTLPSPYLVYCGRYCPEKGLDRLLQYLEQLNSKLAAPIHLVCLGQGPMKLPRKPWLHDKGFVSEAVKRDVIAGALGLIHLSRNESLSIVALEAWAQGVPVIVDSLCAVLVDQVSRSQAGVSIGNAEELDEIVELWQSNPSLPASLGKRGRAFVEAHYASATQYGERLRDIISSMQQPLVKVARQAALQRAQAMSHCVWEGQFSQVIEQVQLQEPAITSADIDIKAMQPKLSLPMGTASTTVTVQLKNMGQRLIAEQGVAAGYLLLSGPSIKERIKLAQPLVPDQKTWQTLALDMPTKTGRYTYRLRLISQRRVLASCKFTITIGTTSQATASIHPLSQTLRQSLAAAKKLEKLPDDYHDVTDGLLAGLKRSLKRKLLNNFRKAYVDVAFRQQSTLNEKLILAMSLLAEGVLRQDTAATFVHLEHRLRKLEKQLRQERRRRLQLEKQLADSPGLSLMEGNVT